MARAYLGLVALLLLVAGFAYGWAGRGLFAASLLVAGILMALLCAFYRNVEGRVERHWLSIRFVGPRRKRG